LEPIAKPLLSKVHRYKEIHKGESCYLVGDGVSVKWFDLGAFSDRITIPCGYTPFHNEFNKLSVQYLTLVEPWWFYPLERKSPKIRKFGVNQIQFAYREIIDKNPDKEFFINLSNAPVLKNKNITYLFRGFHDKRLSNNFISNRINSMHGSVRASITIAIYMGFDHAYLVGYDYTHVPSRTKHWYEKGEGYFLPHENYQKEFFEIAKEFIDITTITLVGSSDFINSTTYKKHTGKEPIYRENTELISEKYCKILDTRSVYTIF
jgi:hypothetical protein